MASYKKCKPTFQSIGNFLEKFDKIFSLSYDPIIYWSILNNKINFKDYFLKIDPDNELIFSPDADKFKNSESSRDSSFIYYIHGALFLYKNENNKICKIKATEENSLRNIVKFYTIDQHKYPMVVLEGTYFEKIKNIYSCDYLLKAYCKLSKLGRNSNLENSESENGILNDICVLGFSANEKDQHIINAICNNGRGTRVTLCIYEEGLDDDGNIITNVAEEQYGDFIKSMQDNNIIVDYYNAFTSKVIPKGNVDQDNGTEEEEEEEEPPPDSDDEFLFP